MRVKPGFMFRYFFVCLTLVFVVLFVLSFSFPHEIIPDIGKWTSVFFQFISTWFADHVLNIKQPYTKQLISDSTGFYVNTLMLIILSAIVSAVFVLLVKDKRNFGKIKYTLVTFCRYYLAMQLLAYAFSKIFKAQFYLPEPNTLFTSVGYTPRDLLYWSVMGTSRAYNIFLGTAELLAASLLLFRRTSLLGSLFSFGIIINIVAINFCYDISVKLYSCFLLLLAIIILVSYSNFIWKVFIGQPIKPRSASLQNSSPRLFTVIKIVVVLLLFIDAILPYAKANNFNDDEASRPKFSGAYAVTSFKLKDTILPADDSNPIRWKRVFIHREGYFIIQFMNEEMKDLKLKVEKPTHQLLLTDYDSTHSTFNYSVANNTLNVITGKFKNFAFEAHLQKLDLTKLPLLQNEFHWTIDGVK